MQRRRAAGAIKRAAQDLAVDGHHTCGHRTGRSSGSQAAALLGEGGHEAPERDAERLRIKLAKQAAERVVARHPVGERQDAAQKWLLGLREQRHVHRTLPAAQHRAQRDEQKLVEVMQAGIAGPRIIQLVPARHKLVQDNPPHAQPAPKEVESISIAPSKPPLSQQYSKCNSPARSCPLAC